MQIGLFLRFFFLAITVQYISAFAGAAVSNRLILQGFNDGMLGYELSAFRFNAEFLGAVEGIGGNYLNLQCDFRLGKVFNYRQDVEFIGAIGVHGAYAGNFSISPSKNVIYSIMPTANITAYKFFDRFIIGGCVLLDLWEFQKMINPSFDSKWYGIRRFSLKPELIIGFCI